MRAAEALRQEKFSSVRVVSQVCLLRRAWRGLATAGGEPMPALVAESSESEAEIASGELGEEPMPALVDSSESEEVEFPGAESVDEGSARRFFEAMNEMCRSGEVL